VKSTVSRQSAILRASDDFDDLAAMRIYVRETSPACSSRNRRLSLDGCKYVRTKTCLRPRKGMAGLALGNWDEVRADVPAYRVGLNWNVISISLSCSAGEYRHFLTASSREARRSGWPPNSFTFTTLPSGPTVAMTRVMPWIFILTASGGYSGAGADTSFRVTDWACEA